MAADALSRRVNITQDNTALKDKTTDELFDLANQMIESNDDNEPTELTMSNNIADFEDYIEFLTRQETPSNFKEIVNRNGIKQIGRLEVDCPREIELLARLKDITKTYTQIGILNHMFPEDLVEQINKILQYLAFKDPDRNYTFSREPIIPIDEETKELIFKENHNSELQHFGENKTLARIKEKYYWPNVNKEIRDMTCKCETCQREKLTRIRPREPAFIPDTPKDPNDKVAMDIYGPLQLTSKGNQYVLSIQDVLTKYLTLIPLPNQQAQTIIEKLMDHYIYIFSTPKAILTDQGANFVSKLMMEFEEAFKIKHIKTTSFHPQSNGSLERAHAVIGDLIRTCTNDKGREWDEILNLVCFGYNTATHEDTGCTPFELTFGRKAHLPSAIAATTAMSKEEVFRLWKRRHEMYLARAKVVIEKNKATNKRNQDKKIRLQNVFKVNDKVLMHNDHKDNKLDSEWLGPYINHEIKSPYYICKNTNGKFVKIHGNRLKIFKI